MSLCSRTYNVSTVNGNTATDLSEPNYGEVFNLNNKTDELCLKKVPGSSVNFTYSLKKQEGIYREHLEDTSSFAFCPVNSLRLPFHEQLLGTVNYTWVHAPYSTSEGKLLSPPAVWTKDTRSTTPSSLQRIISTSLDEVLSNISKSLTKLGLVQSNTTVSGTVFHSEVHAAIKWEWLSLPAALLILSLIFFKFTALVNRTEKLVCGSRLSSRRYTIAWKTDP